MFKKYSEEKGKLVWRLWVILLVEFLGTFAMTLEIIAPGAFFSGLPTFNAIFSTNILKAFWVATFILILIFICRRVSVNLNPAVTMAKIAYGNTRVTTGIWMMLFQVMGGLLAGEAAYLIADAAGTWKPGVTTLDAVAPNLNFNTFFHGVFNIHISEQFNWLKEAPKGTDWFFGLVPFAIESILTFALIASVCYGKNIKKNTRALLIYLTLVIIITIGIPTDNIALNPARLIGPAVASELNGGAQTLQYTWIFFMGQIMAVIVFWYIENLKKDKKGDSMSGVKAQLRVTYAEVLTTNAKYTWVVEGNKPLENMTKTELINTSKTLNIFDSSLQKREDIEYNILEFLIFGKEEKSKTPLNSEEVYKEEKVETKSATTKEIEKTKAKKVIDKPVPKKPTLKPVVKKATSKSKPVVKKVTPTISAAEKAKRDAKRKALHEKAAKAKTGSKITAAELNKLKLTDLYGVGPKTDAYLKENGIDNIVELSKKNVNTMTKKFISGLPALKSFNDIDKKQKINELVEESKYMIGELTK